MKDVEKVLLKTCKINPNEQGARLELANLYYEEKKYDEALEEYENYCLKNSRNEYVNKRIELLNERQRKKNKGKNKDRSKEKTENQNVKYENVGNYKNNRLGNEEIGTVRDEYQIDSKNYLEV